MYVQPPPTWLALFQPGVADAVLVDLGPEPTFAPVAHRLLRDSTGTVSNRAGRFRVQFRQDRQVLVWPVAPSLSPLTWRAVVDLVPLTHQLVSGDPALVDFNHPAGFCYLDLVPPAHREALAAAQREGPLISSVVSFCLAENVPFSDVPLVLTFGTSYAFARSEKFLAHVGEDPLGMPASDLLALCPTATRVGAVGDDVPDGRPPAAVPAPRAPLGGVFDPLVRRRLFSLGTLDVPAANQGARYLLQLNPLNSELKDWARGVPFARWTALRLTFNPLVPSLRLYTSVHLAWYPATESAPLSVADMEKLGTHAVHTLLPALPGGSPGIVSVDAREADGVSFQVKPPPVYGGTAMLAILYQFSVLEGAFPTGKTPAIDLLLDATISAHPAAA